MLIAIGTNYKCSPIQLRERLSFSKKRIKYALSFLKEKGTFKGAAILSTCNRVEIYASVDNAKRGAEEIENFIWRYYEIERQEFIPYFYIHEGRDAIRHLFSVSCGLDSLVLGETQILGQVKDALSQAEEINFTDSLLKRSFYWAISFAKTVREKTGISEGKVSIGSVAIDFLKEKIGSLSDKNILILGVGKVTDLVLKYLKKEKPNVIFVSNRTFEAAKKLASQIGAKAVRFDHLSHFLKRADVVITATASPHLVIKKEVVEEAVNHRLSAKLLILDLALPRDADPRAGEIDSVNLFSLEDLEVVIKENIKKKVGEAKKARRLIDVEIERLWEEFTKSEREPALLP